MVPKVIVYYRVPPTVDDAGRNAVAPDMTGFGQRSSDPNAAGGSPAASAAPLAAPADLTSKVTDPTLGPNTAGVGEVASAGTLTEAQWAVVLRNCSVFFGWKINPISGEITRAPQAAFQLRSTLDQDPVSKIPAFASESATKDPEIHLTMNEVLNSGHLPSEIMAQKTAEARAAANAATEQAAAPELEPRLPVAKPDKGIPNFRVNDDSRIEITVCTHALAMSMAKHDFSSQAIEASVSGGAAGITAGVSAGYSSSNSSAKSKSSTEQTSTLVARYMYPRCDILLRPEDLEPTPGLAALLKIVREKKSINALRRLQDQYGQ